MKCNTWVKGAPSKCPKCGSKLNKHLVCTKCKYKVWQKNSNLEIRFGFPDYV